MSILVSSGAISRRAARAVRHERMSIPRVNQYQRTRLLKVQAHHSVECCPVTDTPRTCACFARLQRPERCPPPRSSETDARRRDGYSCTVYAQGGRPGRVRRGPGIAHNEGFLA